MLLLSLPTCDDISSQSLPTEVNAVQVRAESSTTKSFEKRLLLFAIMTIKAQAPETTQFFFFLTLLLRYADMRALSQRTLNRKNLKKEAGPS
jgi:hypothetical protein